MRRFLPFYSLFFFVFLSTTACAIDLKPPTSLRDVLNQVQSLEPAPKPKPKTDTTSLVSSIIVTGNKAIPTPVIMNEIFTKPGDKLDNFKLDRNASNIQSLGVFSSVTYDLQKTKDGSTIVTFKVIENPVIGKILITRGSNIIKTDDFLTAIKSKSQDVLNLRYVRSDIEQIQKVYKDRGYFQARVQRVIVPKTDMDPLEIIVNEGRIATISVTGNNKTRDYVILREMTVKPGDILQQEKLKEDLRRIYNLNYFTDLQPKILPTGNSYELLIDVTERDTSGQVSFGAGYSPQTGASLQTDLVWDNIVGTGQQISLKGVFGLGGTSAQNTRFQFRYHNPYIMHDHVSFTSKFWITNGQEISGVPGASGSSRYRDEVRRGIELGLGIPLSYEWRITQAIKWESVSIPTADRHYEVNSYAIGIENDTRDVRFNPRDGHYISATIEKAFPFTDRALNFTRYDFLGRKFIPTFEKQTIAFRFDVGYLASDQLDDTVVYLPELYRVGFSDTVRGQNESNFQSSHFRLVTSIEYRFLFNDTFSLVFFMDAGIAPSMAIKDIQYGKDLVVGKGLGVRFLVPGLGPLRVDAGADRFGIIRFQVNVGQAF